MAATDRSSFIWKVRRVSCSAARRVPSIPPLLSARKSLRALKTCVEQGGCGNCAISDKFCFQALFCRVNPSTMHKESSDLGIVQV